MQNIKRAAALLLTAWMVISILAACADPNVAASPEHTAITPETGTQTRQTTTSEQQGSTEGSETETDAQMTAAGPRQIVSEDGKGRIYLYGEYHAEDFYLETELDLWGTCYARGMRDLFMEIGYCDAALMNLWMQAEDDEILLRFYDSIEGTQAHAQNVLDFWHAIKETYPETIIHGFDVEHPYFSVGEWYLSMLRDAGHEDTEAYRLAQEACDQGKTFYDLKDANEAEGWDYRENCMAENFIRAYEQNGCVSVMAIAGSAHCDSNGLTWHAAEPCMANQLKQKYSRTLFAVKDLREYYRGSVKIRFGEEKFKAVILGSYCPADFGFDYDKMKVYQSEDAYETLRTCPQTDLLVPLQYLPISAEAQAVIIVDLFQEDGSKERYFFLTGYIKDDQPAMVQILPEE